MREGKRSRGVIARNKVTKQSPPLIVTAPWRLPPRVLVAGVAALRGVYTECSECARNDKSRGNLAHSERPPERLRWERLDKNDKQRPIAVSEPMEQLTRYVHDALFDHPVLAGAKDEICLVLSGSRAVNYDVPSSDYDLLGTCACNADSIEQRPGTKLDDSSEGH